MLEYSSWGTSSGVDLKQNADLKKHMGMLEEIEKEEVHVGDVLADGWGTSRSIRLRGFERILAVKPYVMVSIST
jgi:hypothetical protein